jgi:hypothetical protein
MIDVDEIEADCVVANRRLTGGGCRHIDGFPGQHFRAAVLMKSNGMGHRESPRCLLIFARQRGYHRAGR